MQSQPREVEQGESDVAAFFAPARASAGGPILAPGDVGPILAV
jgi:hypothetical protein